jgi:hypothetical protein
VSQYLITADAGIALFDPNTYQSFVAEDWTPDKLIAHFLKQMAERRILMWGTGAPGTWQIEVTLKGSDKKGFRELRGSIAASSHKLYFIDYSSLTKAAGLADEKLVAEEMEDMAVPLEPGNYNCRIVQLYDPKKAESAVQPQNGTHFLVELESSPTPLPPWTEVPWLEE